MNNDIKRKNFKRLSEKRLEEISEKIRILGNLANTSNYEYNDFDVKIIIETLRRDIFKLEKKFVTNKDLYKIYNY